MYDQLEIHYEGHGLSPRTSSQALAAVRHLSGGRSWGRCTRFGAFHSFSRKWTFEDPFVEGGEGVMVIGHGLARDWTDMTRGGDAPADQRLALTLLPWA